MKMTIVLDTDDLEGLKDAHKIASMLLKKRAAKDIFHTRQASFGKIQLIKLVRAFAKDAYDFMEEGGDPGDLSTLRFTKKFVDARWDELSRPVLTTS